jgi:hypothetical protein
LLRRRSSGWPLPRPNLSVLALVTLLVIWRSGSRRVLALSIIPLVSVAAAMLWYNYARFGNAVEFGMTYQLTTIYMPGVRPCSVVTPEEAVRCVSAAIHYISWPLEFESTFPWVDLRPSQHRIAVPFPGSEQVVGIAALSPLMLLAAFGALLLIAFRDPIDWPVRSALVTISGGWAVLLFLSTCAYVVVRYQLDYMLLMAAATPPIVERWMARASAVPRWMLQTIVALLAIYSIVAGFLLGFAGRDDAFRRLRPELLARIESFF